MVCLTDTYQQNYHRKKVEGSQILVQGKAHGKAICAAHMIRPRSEHLKAK